MLEMIGVCFAYQRGKPILRDVSLQVAVGEFVVVAGSNGSGKTTLTKLLMGLLKPEAGEILLDGVTTAKKTVAAMARHIGYVFQNPDRQMFRDTVFKEVAYGPEQLGFTSEQVKQQTAAALAATGLTEVAANYPRSLSRGQKQRVAIASALAMKPRVLILDEPTSGQDAEQREHLLQLLDDLNKEGITIILVTHDMDILARYAHRVLVMAGGSKAFDGSARELFTGTYPLTEWGLAEPAAVEISRELASYGISAALSIAKLQFELQLKLREEQA